MDWGAVTAIGTVLTALVVAGTALVGFHQLRLTRVQLEQLRRATQLDGAMKIFEELQSPAYIEARRFVATDLPKFLDDPVFRREVELGIIWTQNPNMVHHEQLILRTFEMIGSHVRQGLLDRDVIVNMAAIPILVAWQHVGAVVEIQRRTINPHLWENFESICGDSRRWFIERSSAASYENWRRRIAGDRPEQL